MDMKKLLSIVDGQTKTTTTASAAGDMKKFMSIVSGSKPTTQPTQEKTVIKESAIDSYVNQVQEDIKEKKQIIDEEVTAKAKRVADKLKEKYGLSEAKKPSAGMTKKEKSAVVKKAKAGKDIGKPGKGFKEVEKAAKKGGAKDPKAVAAAAMWKGQAKKKVKESLNEEGMQQLMPRIAKAKELLAKMPESPSKAKAEEHIAAAEENINAGNSFKALYHIAQFSRYAGTTEGRVIESINIEAMKHYLSRLDERVTIGPDGQIQGGFKPANPTQAPAAAPSDASAQEPKKSSVEKYTPGVTYPAAQTVNYNGKEYKFAGRDKTGPGTGEKIVVGAGAVGIRGLAPVNIELGNDGMYYLAGK